jgi:hypothetical protein
MPQNAVPPTSGTPGVADVVVQGRPRVLSELPKLVTNPERPGFFAATPRGPVVMRAGRYG